LSAEFSLRQVDSERNRWVEVRSGNRNREEPPDEVTEGPPEVTCLREVEGRDSDARTDKFIYCCSHQMQKSVSFWNTCFH